MSSIKAFWDFWNFFNFAKPLMQCCVDLLTSVSGVEA